MPLLEIKRKSPFFLLLIFYAAGILLSAFLSLRASVMSILITFGLLVILLMVFIVMCRKPGYHTGFSSAVVASVILMGAGYLNMEIHWQIAHNHIRNNTGIRPAFIEITEVPAFSRKAIKATGRVWSESKGPSSKLLLYFQNDSSVLRLVPGDIISSVAVIKPIPGPGNPGEFNYNEYMAARAIYGQIFLKSRSWKYAGRTRTFNLKLIAYKLRNEVLKKYTAIGLDKTSCSLLSAITLGYKNDLEAHTKKVFSRAGVMHVMALSGFNVAVIAFMINSLLFFLDKLPAGKIIRNSFVILSIWFFVFVTGLSPSVTRAAVMISLVIIGNLIHRRINTINILYASAFAMLTVSPSMIKDVSFQLSFAAVFGIIFLQPMIYQLLDIKIGMIDKLWQLFTVSCAAQLATLPLTLYYFNQFPVYFWLTNLYVVPLVSVIICMALTYLIFSFIPAISWLLGKVLSVMLTFLFISVSWSESMPYSIIENIRISGLQSFLVFLLIVFLGLLFLNRRIKLVWYPMVIAIVLLLQSINNTLKLNSQRLFVVGNVKGVSAIQFIAGNRADLFLNEGNSLYDASFQFSMSKFWILHGLSKNIYCHKPVMHNQLVEFEQHKILIMNNHELSLDNAGPVGEFDIIVVTGKLPFRRINLKQIKAGMVVLDATVRYLEQKQWIQYFTSQGIQCWPVKVEGAYICNMKK